MTGFDCRPDRNVDPTDANLPDGVTRVECADCGHGVITNRPDDVDKCSDCR